MAAVARLAPPVLEQAPPAAGSNSRRKAVIGSARPVVRAGPGTVYLIHFDRPIGGPERYKMAQHYIGWTNNLPARLAEHASGQGAHLMKIVRDAGISWQLARTWPGGKRRERQLKRQGGASRFCPLCGIRPRYRYADLPRNANGGISSSRTTDGQKQAAGLMTSAQLAEHTALRKGAARGRVPGVQRLRGVPADDPWYSP
jgi:hypothetical protein